MRHLFFLNRIAKPASAVLIAAVLVLGNPAFAAIALAQDSGSVPQTQNDTSPASDSQTVVTGEDGGEGDEGGDGGQGGDGESTGEEGEANDGMEGESGEDGAPGSENEENDGDNGDTGADGSSGNTDAQTATSTDPSDKSDGVPAVIDTGDATSSSSVLNSANTSDTEVTGASSTPIHGTTTVSTTNSLTASSSATTTATTGDNTATDTDGAYVATGAASAFSTLVSLFNIVILNSSGSLLYLQNPLGDGVDLTHDIVNAFSDTASASSACSLMGCSTTGAVFNVVTESTAEITNSLVVRSNTGGNHAGSDGNSSITTGDASAFGSVINFGNLQIVNSRYLVILFNNPGDLNGDIVLPTPEFFAQLSTSARVPEGSDVSVNTENEAEVVNDAVIVADTGSNTATGTATATVETGEAHAQADIHNFVNHNSLGGRPICFIVSIAGEWNGDVVGLPENFEREETPFGEIICGAGTASSNASLPEHFSATTTNYARVLNTMLVEATTGGNTAEGENVDIQTGDAKAFLQILNLVNQNIIGQDWLFALLTVTGDFNGDLTFGSREFWDSVNSQVDRLRGGTLVLRHEGGKTKIEKTASASSVTASSSVAYQVRLYNAGGRLYDAYLVDRIVNEEGVRVHEQHWELGTVEAHEEILIDYSVFFSASTTPGIYTNEAFVVAIERHPNIAKNYGNRYESPVAVAEVQITAPEVEEAPAFCPRYLTKYIRFGSENDPVEVAKLQQFLIEFEGAPITVNGIYDTATHLAVHAFQTKHADKILTPWDATTSTGYVYYTTQQTVNEIYCQGQRDFPLTLGQQVEIENYRLRLREIIDAGGDPTEMLQEIGQADGSPQGALALGGAETENSEQGALHPNPQVAAVQQAARAAEGVFARVHEAVNAFMGWIGDRVASVASFSFQE